MANCRANQSQVLAFILSYSAPMYHVQVSVYSQFEGVEAVYSWPQVSPENKKKKTSNLRSLIHQHVRYINHNKSCNGKKATANAKKKREKSGAALFAQD